MKNVIKISTALILIAVMLSSCAAKSRESAPAEETADAWTYTFTDSLGNEVTLNEKPSKAAVLFSSYAEIWTEAGGEIAVTVGDSVKRGFVGEDAVLVDDGPGLNVDEETLVAAEPDFVIVTADFPNQVAAAELLAEQGVPVAVFREECFEDYLDILKIFTDITGNTEAYEQIESTVAAGITDLLEKTEDRIGPTYLFIRAGSTAKSTKAKTAEDHFACVMLDEIGCCNIADGVELFTEELSLEAILERQPEVILIAPQGDEEAAKEYIGTLFSEDGWKDLDAVKEGRVHFVEKELFNYKPNSRWLESYETLMEIVYPAQ